MVDISQKQFRIKSLEQLLAQEEQVLLGLESQIHVKYGLTPTGLTRSCYETTSGLGLRTQLDKSTGIKINMKRRIARRNLLK